MDRGVRRTCKYYGLARSSVTGRSFLVEQCCVPAALASVWVCDYPHAPTGQSIGPWVDGRRPAITSGRIGWRRPAAAASITSTTSVPSGPARGPVSTAKSTSPGAA